METYTPKWKHLMRESVTAAAVTDTRTHTLKCQQCGREFGAKRSDAKFCTANCRKASSRRASQIKRAGMNAISEIYNIIRIAGDDERLQVIAALQIEQIAATCDGCRRRS